MICFCGDSYAEDNKADSGGLLRNQWHRILTQNLYGDKYYGKYLNFATGSTSIDHLIEEQLIKKVLPKYPEKPLEYLVASITFNERFLIGNTTSWYPGMPVDTENEDIFNGIVKFRLKYDSDYMMRRSLLLATIFKYLEKFGTKIFVFNVDTTRGLYVDDRYYFHHRSINRYVNIEENAKQLDYSNHFSEKHNIIIGEAFHKEIINKNEDRLKG